MKNKLLLLGAILAVMLSSTYTRKDLSDETTDDIKAITLLKSIEFIYMDETIPTMDTSSYQEVASIVYCETDDI